MVNGQALSTGRWAGFAVIQSIIVILIAATVVAVAVPVYAGKAKGSVLRENVRTLEFEVQSYLVALDATYGGDQGTAASVVAHDERSAPEVIAQALARPGEGVSAYYVNPFSGSHAIIHQRALPPAAAGTPPAVWITDDKHYAYGAFTASPMTKSRLRGTLVVVFVARRDGTRAVQVFYVDAAGGRSPSAATLTI